MLVDEARAHFLLEIKQHKAENTTLAYAACLESFVQHVGAERLTTDVAPATIESFVTDVLKRKYRPSTAALYAVSLRAFVRYLIRRELVVWSQAGIYQAEDYLAGLRLKRSKKLPRIPSQESVEAILRAAHESPLPALLKLRNIALAETLASTGCRIHEVALLRVGDIDTRKREAIVTGKGDKERKVYFSASAIHALDLYWRERGWRAKDNPAFARHDDGAGKRALAMTTRGLRDVIDVLALAAGVDGFTPHKFRHVFASRLLEETSDLSMVQLALGHESPETTKVYAHVNPEIVHRAHQQIWR